MPRPADTSSSLAKSKPTLAARHQAAVQTLAAKYDALNEQFVNAEGRLKALKPLHSVWISYNPQSREGGPDFWELLGLHKLDGKWRLVHATDSDLNDDGSPPHDIKPITECPIQIRIGAAKEVRQLHEEIVRQKESLIPEVEEAIAALTKYCSQI